MSAQQQSTYFDDKAIAAMIVAYDMTCRSLQPSDLQPLVREMIGKRIIEAARQGERDPKLMHQQALKNLRIEEIADVLAA
jgi:hypothetical protein